MRLLFEVRSSVAPLLRQELPGDMSILQIWDYILPNS